MARPLGEVQSSVHFRSLFDGPTVQKFPRNVI